jgi:hypothetical protein
VGKAIQIARDEKVGSGEFVENRVLTEFVIEIAWTDRQVTFVEVDVNDMTTRSQSPLQVTVVGGSATDVMECVGEEDHVNGSGG